MITSMAALRLSEIQPFIQNYNEDIQVCKDMELFPLQYVEKKREIYFRFIETFLDEKIYANHVSNDLKTEIMQNAYSQYREVTDIIPPIVIEFCKIHETPEFFRVKYFLPIFKNERRELLDKHRREQSERMELLISMMD
ncbi:hypothetical protein RZN25_11440 [Bacillaceae bacterium S4-13-56]